MRVPKSFFAIVPLKVVMSVVTTLVVLMVIAVGGGAAEVGIVMSLSLFGNLLGNLVWAKVLSTSRKYITGYIGGYFGLFISLLILLSGDLISIFLAAFLITFISNLTYLAAMFLISEEYEKRVNEMMGIFEMIGGWAWVIGLAIGALIVGILTPQLLISSLSMVSFFAIILSSILLGSSILRRIIEGFKKDFGLLPLLDMGLNRVIEYEEMLPDVILHGVHVIYSGNIMYFPVYIKAKLPSRERATFYIAMFIQFLSFGLVYSQFIKFLKDLGYANSIIYFISLISSMISAIVYPMAGRVKRMVGTLISMGIVRIVLFTLLISIAYLPASFITPIIILFALLDGYSWAYISILLNLLALRVSKEEVGISNFIRNVGNILGAFLSGLIITMYNYQLDFLIAIVMLGASLVFYKKLTV